MTDPRRLSRICLAVALFLLLLWLVPARAQVSCRNMGGGFTNCDGPFGSASIRELGSGSTYIDVMPRSNYTTSPLLSAPLLQPYAPSYREDQPVAPSYRETPAYTPSLPSFAEMETAAALTELADIELLKLDLELLRDLERNQDQAAQQQFDQKGCQNWLASRRKLAALRNKGVKVTEEKVERDITQGCERVMGQPVPAKPTKAQPRYKYKFEKNSQGVKQLKQIDCAPTGTGPKPTTDTPSLAEFMAVMRPDNPCVSDQKLRHYWADKYAEKFERLNKPPLTTTRSEPR